MIKSNNSILIMRMSPVNCMKLSLFLEENDSPYYSQHQYYTNDNGELEAQVTCINHKDISQQEVRDFLTFLHKEKCLYSYEHILINDEKTEIYQYTNQWENSYDKSSSRFNYDHIDNDIIFKIR